MIATKKLYTVISEPLLKLGLHSVTNMIFGATSITEILVDWALSGKAVINDPDWKSPLMMRWTAPTRRHPDVLKCSP